MESMGYVFADNSCTHLAAHTSHQFSTHLLTRHCSGKYPKVALAAGWNQWQDLKPSARAEPVGSPWDPVSTAQNAQSSEPKPAGQSREWRKASRPWQSAQPWVQGHPCVMGNLDQLGSTWINLASFQPCRHSEAPEDHLWFVWHSRPT